MIDIKTVDDNIVISMSDILINIVPTVDTNSYTAEIKLTVEQFLKLQEIISIPDKTAVELSMDDGNKLSEIYDKLDKLESKMDFELGVIKDRLTIGRTGQRKFVMD